MHTPNSLHRGCPLQNKMYNYNAIAFKIVSDVKIKKKLITLKWYSLKECHFSNIKRTFLYILKYKNTTKNYNFVLSFSRSFFLLLNFSIFSLIDTCDLSIFVLSASIIFNTSRASLRILISVIVSCSFKCLNK